jgi:hypothetical protein
MAMEEGKSKITTAELIKQLQSGQPADKSKALKKLSRVAGIRDLPAIVRVMAGFTDRDLLEEFTTFLSNIKSKEAPAVIAGFLSDPALAGIRLHLTRSCWESQLDYSAHLMIFARLFITGDYGLAVEAFSVIENTCMEHPVDRTLIREINALVSNSIPDQPETKKRLVNEMLLVLKPFAEGD